MRAFTLGYPGTYDQHVRTPGNGKAPGGYVFRTRQDAVAYRDSHAEAARYEPYEMELPDRYELCVTDSAATAQAARHEWHTTRETPTEFMLQCGVCNGTLHQLDCDLLVVPTLFIDPDTGDVV